MPETCLRYRATVLTKYRAHLYRHHRIFQCHLRCKTIFKNQEELEQHLGEAKGCELSAAPDAEGVTEKMEKRLRSRKKTSLDQSEEDRWREIYGILFPIETTFPSPCQYLNNLRLLKESYGIPFIWLDLLSHY